MNRFHSRICKLSKLSIILLSASVSPLTFAIAPVESRGEPMSEIESFSTSRSSQPSSYSSSSTTTTGPKRSDDRILQTLNQIESLKQEVSDLRGQLEIQDHEMKQLKKSQQDFYLDLEKRIAQVQTAKGNRQADATAAQTINKSKGIQIIPKGKETSKNTQSKVNDSSTATAATASASATVPTSASTTVPVDQNPDLSKNAKPNPATTTVVNTDTKSPSVAPKNKTSQVVKITPKPVTSITPGSQPGTFQTHEVTNEKEAFDRAYGMVTSKQYDQAICALQDFLNQYPKGSYAPNAHYWLGEIHMVKWQGDKSKTQTLDEASRYFNNVSKDFPGTAKVSDSLLKLGIIAAERGDVGGARRYFTDVKMQYPDSAAARVAEAKLQQTQ